MVLQISPSLARGSSDCEKLSTVIGKGGAFYKKHGAFCLETQKFADGIHHVRNEIVTIFIHLNFHTEENGHKIVHKFEIH